MTCPVCGSPVGPEMRFCSMCGAALQGRPAGRERRRVSVVFIDLAGFTTVTTGFDPEELRDFADEILTVVAGVIEDYDGYVDTFTGDGLIALFGAPRSHPDDPQRAVQAAAAGLRAIETIGKSRGYHLQGRAGVNTGVVIAGSVGLGRAGDYTVMGSAVNLAARLEAVARPGEVWVGPETFEATRHLLRYLPSPPLQLRGFPDITQAYRLQEDAPRESADPYQSLRFVGRQRELQALREAYAAASTANHPQLVWLVGEAGSGKTRLLREFTRELTDARTLWLDRQRHAGLPWHGWSQLGAQLFGLSAGDDLPLRRRKVQAALQELAAVPSLTKTDPHHWHQTILHSMGLGPNDPPPGSDFVPAWLRLFAALAHTKPAPLLLVVDQVPEGGRLTALLTGLQQQSFPGLILRTSRGQGLPARATSITLGPLALEESFELLMQVANPALEVATRSLVSQVGGIPAYVLELGRALGMAPEGGVSGSLASLLQARLDMLTPDARGMLGHAALCGERSWQGLLFALGGSKDTLADLTTEGLLVEESGSSIPGELELRFQSELLRGAVLRMIPKSERGTLHARIAAWLETNAPLSYSRLIGDHFLQAGSPESAYPHFLAAAETAAAQGDYERARELYTQLLKLDLAPELMAQAALAYAQTALTHHDDDALREALAAGAVWLGQAEPGERSETLRTLYETLLQQAGATQADRADQHDKTA